MKLTILASLLSAAAAAGYASGSIAQGGPVTPATAVTAPPPAADRAAELARIRSERNIKVCRDTSDGLAFLSGTVLGRERGKIQVRVTDQTEKATGKGQASFHATNVWDDPANWRICP